MENELVVDKANEIMVSRPPEIVLAEAKRAAQALQEVISNKQKKVMFNGEQYLEFEDWQTIGKFYGLVARTLDSEPVEIDGIHGAKAKAEVINVNTGEIIGKAEAWCLRDEPNWKNKPWFQLASMAQTRAASKSLSNLLRWVVVLAGYKGTPSEEINSDESFKKDEGFKKPEIIDGKEVPAHWPSPAGVADRKPGCISVSQQKRLYAISKKADKSEEEIKLVIKQRAGVDHVSDIHWQKYEDICNELAKPH